jgi:LPXTG-motif cell wall-anchored protein
MRGRRLLVAGVVCGLLLMFGSSETAYAKTCQCAYDEVVTTPHDTAVDVNLEVAGDYGPVIEIKIVSGPEHGTATATVPAGSDGQIHYVPDAGYVGPDFLTFDAVVGYSEGLTGVLSATVSITVTGPAPTTTTTAPATTTTVAVAATTVPATTVPTPTTIAAAAELPRTGSGNGGLAVLGAGTIVAGIAALTISRRRFRHSRA